MKLDDEIFVIGKDGLEIWTVEEALKAGINVTEEMIIKVN